MAAIADPTVASSALTRRARDTHPALPAGPPMAMQRENHTLLEEWAYQRFDGAEAERTGCLDGFLHADNQSPRPHRSWWAARQRPGHGP